MLFVPTGKEKEILAMKYLRDEMTAIYSILVMEWDLL